MIEVSDGYARNYMLPRKMAIEATPDNVNTMRVNDRANAEKRQREREEAFALSNRLKDMTVVVKAKGGGGRTPVRLGHDAGDRRRAQADL